MYLINILGEDIEVTRETYYEFPDAPGEKCSYETGWKGETVWYRISFNR